MLGSGSSFFIVGKIMLELFFITFLVGLAVKPPGLVGFFWRRVPGGGRFLTTYSISLMILGGEAIKFIV